MKNKTVSFILIIAFLTAILSIMPLGQCEETDEETQTEFISIQEAINTTFEGDTVYIYPGEYHEDILINKSVNLEGKSIDGSDPVIIGNVTIAANNVSISNLYIQDGSGITIAGYVIAGNSSIFNNITIENNFIENNSAYGIYARWAYDVNIFDNVVKNNNGGIFIQYCNSSIIQKNTITNSNEDGIYLNFAWENTLYKNTIENNNRGLYCIFSAEKNIIYENTFEKNQEYGIYIYEDTSNFKNELYHNSFVNNTINAYDGGKNYWNTSKEGNYWDDYAGVDEDPQDAIGDSVYEIAGANNEDKYPLMSEYNGGRTIEQFNVDRDLVKMMLIVGIIFTIIFVIPIGLWWRKKYFK